MIPVLGAVAVSAGREVVGRIGEGLGSLFGGETATDRARAATTQGQLTAALAGDRSALEALTTAAFIADRPKAVKDLARKALQQFYAATGEQPPEQYRAALKVPVTAKPPTIAQQLTTPVIQAIGTTAVDAAEGRARERATSYLPYALGAAVVLVAVLYFSRKG